MDYEKAIKNMLQDVCNDFTKEKYAEFVKALGIGLAEAMALIKDGDHLAMSMTMMFTSITEHASECWRSLHESEGHRLTAEDFLRDHFNPDHKND